MGTVARTSAGPTYPVLVVMPWAWMASGRFDVGDYADRWQSWQHCGACLPMALHRLALNRDDDFERINGKLIVALVQVDTVQNCVLAASGADIDRPLPVKPFPEPLDAERVYQLHYHPEYGDVDPADALSVVFTGVAGRIDLAIAADAATNAAAADVALAYGVGATVAGLCTGTADPSDPARPGPSAFADVWGKMAGASMAGQLTCDDIPARLADVPLFLARLKMLSS